MWQQSHERSNLYRGRETSLKKQWTSTSCCEVDYRWAPCPHSFCFPSFLKWENDSFMMESNIRSKKWVYANYPAFRKTAWSADKLPQSCLDSPAQFCLRIPVVQTYLGADVGSFLCFSSLLRHQTISIVWSTLLFLMRQQALCDGTPSTGSDFFFLDLKYTLEKCSKWIGWWELGSLKILASRKKEPNLSLQLAYVFV